MADISRVTLPSGSVYYLKDAQARTDIADIRNAISGGIHYIGTTTTELSEGSTTQTITIGGESYTAAAGDLVISGELEFIWDDTAKVWHKFGPTGTFKALAFKDSATGDYTPAGEVSKPSFTGTQGNISANYTPSGDVTITTGNGTANYTPAGEVSKPTFSGTEGDISASYTPAGSVTISKGNGTANYTPEGSVSAPSVSVEMNTATVEGIDSVGTLPSCTLPIFATSVNEENLSFSWTDGSFSAGTLPTKAAEQTFATTVKSATATAPTFTGTGAELTASFNGTAGTATGKFTPAGDVSKPTFTGTGADLEASFSGTQGTATGTFTPAGEVSKPSFTGSLGSVTVS